MPFVITSHWDKAIGDVTSAVREGLSKAADRMKDEIVSELHASKSGRIYGSHQASAPSESPASDTKALEDSIDIIRNEGGDLQVAIFPTVPYADELEFGSGRIAPRPMWAPVGMRLGGDRGDVIQIIAREIEKRAK